MIVAYRLNPEDGWTVHRCYLSGRIDFNRPDACYRARDYVRTGHAEARVMQGDEVIARFWRSPTGEVLSEGKASI